jgi:hypothetical protein
MTVEMRNSDTALGEAVAELIWKDDPAAAAVVDPRTSAFASAVIEQFSNFLAHTPGVIKKQMRSAASAAEDLNVEPFQGLVEVIQNADDLGATEVRFAVRKGAEKTELLIVHNGAPVTCHHVLAMALAFLTTKTNQPDQRGRFGIGLKTLRRIAASISIHSAPYHFSGDQSALHSLASEPVIPGFYDATRDTMVVLELKPDFEEDKLRIWFDAWGDDGLVFLSSVARFQWLNLDGELVADRRLTVTQRVTIKPALAFENMLELRHREARGSTESWDIWSAIFPVPAQLKPAHKSRSETARVSIAVPNEGSAGALFIGFKTRVPVDVSFLIDAPFDPSTARETMVENALNGWLIERCGELIAEVAAIMMLSEPMKAWRLVPVSSEHIGGEADRWLRGAFAASFAQARQVLGERSSVLLPTGSVPLLQVSYEEECLTPLLENADIEALAANTRALSHSVRDSAGRWRLVLDEIGVCAVVETGDVLEGFAVNLFSLKSPPWWVAAATILVENHPDDDLFEKPYWLSDDGRALPCRHRHTGRPLVLSGEPSQFAKYWQLIDRLHPTYAGQAGETATRWLSEHAAFKDVIDAEIELEAFAEKFAEEPLEISDAELRELRDRFDALSDRRGQPLGIRVGSAILVDGFVYQGGRVERRKVSPAEAYLGKTLDGDAPNWPIAAGTLPGISWIAARYEDQLKTGATRRMRKRDDGTISRGVRRFMMLLGGEVAPRLVRTEGKYWGNATRTRELRAVGAERVDYDWTSPDLEKIMTALPALAKRSSKEARARSAALFNALARNWDRLYAPNLTVPSEHVARVYTYPKGPVRADWLIKLRETSWVAIGKGKLVPPPQAVIKTIETQAHYAAGVFVAGIERADFSDDFARSLDLIVSVLVSDFVSDLEEARDGHTVLDEGQILQIYRNIAKYVPDKAHWRTQVGNMTVQELRTAFGSVTGLIRVAERQWRRPAEVHSGKDIFHEPERFAPGGVAYAGLWAALDIRPPKLDDCVNFLRKLNGVTYDTNTESRLIDVYRYMEPLLEGVERRHKGRLRGLPIYCGERWVIDRPIYLVDDRELRTELAAALPKLAFWTPPCDVRDLPRLVSMLGITRMMPLLTVSDDRQAAFQRGEGLRDYFERAVSYLSDELARNDTATREQLSVGWDALRRIPLFIHETPVAVRASDEVFGNVGVPIKLQAHVSLQPLELHAWENALGRREYGGHAIASLFPPEARRRIEAEWVVAWQEGQEVRSEAIRLASDEEHAEAMRETAERINTLPKKRIKVSQPSKREQETATRMLKRSVGPISSASITQGQQPTRQLALTTPSNAPLRNSQPAAKPREPAPRTAPAAYTNAELEQRGSRMCWKRQRISVSSTFVIGMA